MPLRSIVSRLSPAVGFARAEGGNVAIMFGLSFTSLAVCAGLAIDMGIALDARTRLAQSIDSAALSAAKAARIYNLNASETKAIADQYVKAQLATLGDKFSTLATPVIKVPDDVSEVDIKLTAVYRTRFGGIVGVPTFNIETSGAARIQGFDVEVGMQLDVTGSMDQDQAGVKKIVALKASAKKAIDILIPDKKGPQKVRVGYAPFAVGVNAGAFAKSVSNLDSTKCIWERKNLSKQTSDVSPTGLDALSKGNSCPSSTVMPLSDDKAALKAGIDTLSADGATAGHLGAAWSWYLISPNWAGIWGGDAPAPYNDGKTLKFSVMMTDGEYNTFAGSTDNNPTSFPYVQSSKYAADTCTEIKNKGVRIYTIGFGNGITGTAKTTLENCASDLTKFFLALNQAELDNAFEAIARDIVALKLSR